MSRTTVSADFHNADSRGRLRLNCVGTIRDLAEKQITLRERLHLTLSDDDLEADGEVHFAEDEHLWVAVIDWDAIRQRGASVGPVDAPTRTLEQLLRGVTPENRHGETGTGPSVGSEAW